MSKETTIGQLQEVDVLNDNDELVVAQEGQRMARKTNIATLAAKVGESIGGGASMDGEEAAALLTELQTKYAQGKIALAKALTSKGQETAASEDMITMVDKVTNLNTDQNTETLWGPQIESVASTSYASSGSYYYRHVESTNGIVAIYNYQARNLCVYKQTALARSFTLNEILENSVFLTLDTQLTNQNYSIGISGDGTKIVLCTEAEIRLFEYNDNAKTITLTKTLTGAFKYVYGSSLAIKNDGSLMFWFYGTTSTYFLDIETGTLTDMSNKTGLPSSFNYLRECEFFDDKIHAVVASNNYRAFCSFNYTKDESGMVNVSNARYFTMYASDYSDVRYIYGRGFALCLATEGSSVYHEDKAHGAKCRVRIFDFDTWTYYSDTYADFYFGLSNSVVQNTYCDRALSMALYCSLDTEGDVTTIHFPLFKATLRYDKANHTLTSDKTEYFYNSTAYGINNQPSELYKATKVVMVNYAETDTHIYLSAFPKDNFTDCCATSSKNYYYISLVFRKDTFLANVKTLPNGKTTYIKQPHVTATEIAAGEFDRQTIVTPETE